MSAAAIKIEVDPGKVFGRQLSELETKQLPYAVMQTINGVAYQARSAWAAAIASQLDRPTAFTRRSTLVTPATKANLTATVFIRDQAAGGNAPATYLQEQVLGGGRRRKALENKLGAMRVLPAGMFAVPGKDAKRDAAGNISRTQTSAIIAALGQGEKDGQMFALTSQHGKLSPGVYQRRVAGRGKKRGVVRGAVKSLLRFVTSGKYRKRLDIFGIAQRVVTRRFPDLLEAELAKAVASTWKRAFK